MGNVSYYYFMKKQRPAFLQGVEDSVVDDSV
jgi:hypothetical protein